MLMRALHKVVKVPILGWAIGLIAALALCVWFLLIRARTLAARLKVENSLRVLRRQHHQYIKKQVEGHGRASSKVAKQWQKLERQKLSRIRDLQKEAVTNKGLAGAFNEVFRR